MIAKELKELFGTCQTTKLDHSNLPALMGFGSVGSSQLSCLGEKDLPALRQVADPCGSRDRGAKPIAVSFIGGADMYPRSQKKRVRQRPVQGFHCDDYLFGRINCAVDAVVDRHVPIAGVLESEGVAPEMSFSHGAIPRQCLMHVLPMLGPFLR